MLFLNTHSVVPTAVASSRRYRIITQRSTVMRKTHSDNELFTFRVWLVRLGLNGPEFKNTRDHLLANLEGDRAWRYDKDSYEVNKKKKNRTAER